MSDSTALVPAASAAIEWYTPRSLHEAQEIARVFAKSGLLSRAVDTPEKALAIVATGAELGLSPMASLRGIYIVEGKPTLSADTMVALIRQSGHCVYWQRIEQTADSVTYETQRKGDPNPTRQTFTVEDAKRAGRWGAQGPWSTHPQRMMAHRCASILAREVYPDVLAGCYLDDEAGEIAAPVPIVASVVTPLAPADPQPPPLVERIESAQTMADLTALKHEADTLKRGTHDRKAAVDALMAAKARIEAQREPGSEG